MADTAADPQFLTTREVAGLLRVKERKIYELAAADEIPCRRVTGKLLFPRAEIEAWLAGGVAAATAASTVAAETRPDIVVGSHDPLLDWALRESGSGLAAFFDGSLDGLERMRQGGAVLCGTHVVEPERGDWNIGHVATTLADAPCVLIEWARRRQGLILAPEAPAIDSVAALKGRRVALRQPKAGGRLLFDHLLAEAGLSETDMTVLPTAARTETDAAAAVAANTADATLGLEAMARQFRLRFVPLAEERYDLLVWRRAYFEPPLQALFGFAGTPAFAAHAAELGGYDIGGLGTVRWNGA
ncbi:MAG: helix-turn-helix transcriptional regulator [Inquilinus sp.]|nr:helix-turn-helix transcriptional regulator [Inquilinus sp.]